MSGYRALAGWGVLKRKDANTPAVDLPFKDSTTRYSPEELLINPVFETGETYTKWQRFGGGVTLNVTTNRNINFHNDIGLRTYTVATTGLMEADFSISGFVSAKYMEWMKFALNADCVKYTFMQEVSTLPPGGIAKGYVVKHLSDGKNYIYEDGKYVELAGIKIMEVPNAVTETYHYNNLDGPKLFDIAYVQSNKRTNEYGAAGAGDEFHILTGCAVNTFSFSYELSSDAGIKFTIDGYALMDFFSLGEIKKDVNEYFEDIPKQVFSTACISTKDTGETDYQTIAQTDSATITINNFIERRGNCLANWASGYSMGTLNFEMESSTYSNDPNKYMLAMYGYNRRKAGESTPRIYAVTKVPHVIPGFCFYTNDEDPIGLIAPTESFAILATNTIVSEIGKEYSAESAIMDAPKMRAQNATICISYTQSTADAPSATNVNTPVFTKDTPDVDDEE